MIRVKRGREVEAPPLIGVRDGGDGMRVYGLKRARSVGGKEEEKEEEDNFFAYDYYTIAGEDQRHGIPVVIEADCGNVLFCYDPTHEEDGCSDQTYSDSNDENYYANEYPDDCDNSSRED